MGIVNTAWVTLSWDPSKALAAAAEKSYDDKRTYVEKLESATGVNIYKYVLLINVSALEGYVAEARLQAQQSFNLSRMVALAGFAIIAVAIILSVYLTITGNQQLHSAYLAGIAGALTEFIAGVFLYLYSKTLSQINVFHDKLVDMQKTALVYISETASEGKALAEPLRITVPVDDDGNEIVETR